MPEIPIITEEAYRERLENIQSIVNWKDEKRVGLIECGNLGKLPEITLSDIKNKSKNLPENVDIFVVGGIVDRGKTRHDIDVFILNNSDKSKDTIDSEINKALLGHNGRMSRVYNLDKFEKDMTHLKRLIERFDKSDMYEKTKLCDDINPTLEIHSHCKKDEKISDFRSECLAKSPEETSFSNIYKCNIHDCNLIRMKR